MIPTLYDIFKPWANTGSVYIMSDTHFNDFDCQMMDPNWISAEEQIAILNKRAHRSDTLILLGDIGDPECARQLKAYKVLITGNHDVVKNYRDIFDEIYTGPLMIAEKILLSHEPISMPSVLNIHGHVHDGKHVIYTDRNGNKHMNLAANVCGYKPVSLGEIIKQGILADVTPIHRETIDKATQRKKKRIAAGQKR